MQLENTPVSVDLVDTNEEYIIPQNAAKEPAVMGTVFRAIIVETVKGFFGGIIGFFLRYIRHFVDGFRYFWSPSLKKHPFDTKDYKDNCQHAFELTLIAFLAVVFMVKLSWIPPTETTMLEWLNNDLSQMGVQFMMFVFFAFTYLTLSIFSIVTGRIWRAILRIKVTGRESDILFIYLNNSFFSIAAVVGLIVRCMVSMQTTDADSLAQGLVIIFLPICLIANTIWSIRFAKLNGLGTVKSVIFFLLATLIYPLCFTLGQIITVAFLMNI
jgi:hypothetical protein